MGEFTAKGLVEYCKQALGWKTVYMWGGLMKTVTQAFIDYKKKQYPKYYSEARVKQLQTKIGNYYGCDCVGLIKSYLFGGINSPKYKSKWDTNTRGMYSVSKTKGTIETLPEIQGLILYMKGHVGVYIGNGECIECTLGKYGDGVVKTKVAGRGWTHWLQLPWLDYNDGVETECGCDCPCCKEKCKKKTEIDNEFFGVFGINQGGGGLPRLYTNKQIGFLLPHNDSGYLISMVYSKLKKEDNWQHITYMPYTGMKYKGKIPLYIGGMSKMQHKAFYSDNKLALIHNTTARDTVRDYYITLPNGQIIKDICFARNVYVSNKLWGRGAFVFENIELHSGDVITVFSEAAYTIGCYFKLKMVFNEKGESQSVGYDVEHKVIEWLPPTNENRIQEYHFN